MSAADTELIESRNPANGELIGTVPVAGPDMVAAACGRAARAQQAWSLRPIAERAAIVDRAADYILYNASSYADLVRQENGKPRSDALIVEVASTVDNFRWLARHAERILDDELLAPSLTTLVFGAVHRVKHEPLGVIGVISPWNYPLSIPAGEVAAALVAGNGVVLKPAPATPLTAARLAEAFEEAGLPDGLFEVVQGDVETGQALVTDPHVRKVVFTGSVAAGTAVAKAAGEHRKPVVLELGGKDPAIVRHDADLDRAAAEIVWAGCSNAGQTCVGAERVYVHRRVYEPFVERLVERTRSLRVGDPAEGDVEVGPMISEEQWARVVELVEDAESKGARRLTGGPVEVPGRTGRFYAPTVLVDVDHRMRVMQEEVFGPVVPVMPVVDDEEALRLANDSDYGLGASIWTTDRRTAARMAEALDVGMVWVNGHAYSHGAPMTPWGGRKDSGMGTVHSRWGLYEMTHRKLVSQMVGPFPPVAFPNEPEVEAATGGVLEALLAPTWGERLSNAWRQRRDIATLLTHRFRAVRGRSDG